MVSEALLSYQLILEISQTLPQIVLMLLKENVCCDGD